MLVLSMESLEIGLDALDLPVGMDVGCYNRVHGVCYGDGVECVVYRYAGVCSYTGPVLSGAKRVSEDVGYEYCGE